MKIANGVKKVVVIGGGTGTFTVLRGLKNYPHDISVVVTMFDSGGSSGVLRDEHGILPPGDVRKCLVALSSGKQEEILRELFTHRFSKGSSLKGHTFGNIFLTALTEILGKEDRAINEAGSILNIKGNVLPVSLKKAHLCAELEDGSVIEGESNIDVPKHDGNLQIVNIFLKPKAKAHKEAIKAIEEADVVVIGPGDLYTSIIPNLLAGGISKALKKSKAKVVYILNLFTKWGNTNNYSASDHAKEVLRYSRLKRFDYIVCNVEKMPKEILIKYKCEKKFPVEIDEDIYKYGENILKENLCRSDHLLRHGSRRVAKVIDSLI